MNFHVCLNQCCLLIYLFIFPEVRYVYIKVYIYYNVYNSKNVVDNKNRKLVFSTVFKYID